MKEYFNLNYKWHRIGLPAIIYDRGECEYSFNGGYHRINGLISLFYKEYFLYYKMIDMNVSKLVI